MQIYMRISIGKEANRNQNRADSNEKFNNRFKAIISLFKNIKKYIVIKNTNMIIFA